MRRIDYRVWRMALATPAFLTLVANASLPNPPKHQEILPLETILAYKMPCTRDIESIAKASDMQLLDAVVATWYQRADKLKFKDVARPGFAVSGCGIEALCAALKLSVAGKNPRDDFLPDEEISLFFFAEPVGGNRVHIRRVKFDGDRIQIHYQLIPSMMSNHSRVNIALIPLGMLSTGKYEVEMKQLRRDQRLIDLGFQPFDWDWSRNYLCAPFQFRVED